MEILVEGRRVRIPQSGKVIAADLEDFLMEIPAGRIARKSA